MIKSFVARNVYEPLYAEFYRRDNRVKLYRFYKRAQWKSLNENRKIQAQRLYALIKYASENVPYYKELVNKNSITFSEKTIFSDIKTFPVLTKEIIRKESKNLYKAIPGIKWYYNTSGGSTGEPVKFIQDWSYQAHSAAVSRIQFEWAGYKLGDRQVILWGSEKDIFKQKEKFLHRFANWIKSNYWLNSFYMNDSRMHVFVNTINRKKPSIIYAYAQSAFELAKFIKKNKLYVYSPKAVMTGASVLHPHFRETIERVFGCRVYDKYGSREVGNVACECERHEGLHVSIFTHFIEILDKDLQPCKEDQKGEIYITLLTNYTMPLIRYKIGDFATFTRQKCSCGRGMPIIKNIVGRSVDLFINDKNELVDGEYFTHLFYFKNYIKRFQLIQKSRDLLILNILLNTNNDAKLFKKDFPRIRKNIRLVMGKNCKVEYSIVKEIKASKSGKFRYTIREC